MKGLKNVRIDISIICLLLSPMSLSSSFTNGGLSYSQTLFIAARWNVDFLCQHGLTKLAFQDVRIRVVIGCYGGKLKGISSLSHVEIWHNLCAWHGKESGSGSQVPN